MSTTTTSSPPVPWSVLQNNWLEPTRKYIAEKASETRVAFTIWPDPDPAPGCSKQYTASYTCSPGKNVKTVKVRPEAGGNIAIFNCSAEYAKCTGGILTLKDDGNLVLSNGRTVIWQSNTKKIGVPLKQYNAESSKYKRNFLKTGEFLYPNEFIGSPSGNCALLCDIKDNICSLSIVYYLWGCNMGGQQPSTFPGNNNGYITDIDGFRATYSVNETNKDTSLNGKVIYINRDMERMVYPEKMLSLSNEYIRAGSYSQDSSSIKTISNSDLDNCKSECSAINNCYGIIHYNTDKNCELKGKTEIYPNNLKRELSYDAEMFVRKYKIANPNSCNGDIINEKITAELPLKMIDGGNMTPDTLCTLGEATSEQLQVVKNRETELEGAMSDVSKSLTDLNVQNNKLDSRVKRVVNVLNDKTRSYNAVIHNTNKAKEDIDNIIAMSSVSKLENVRENMNYMAWTAVASIAIFTVLKTSR